MRGNELRSAMEGDRAAFSFPIPMRGNELSPHRTHAAATRFPIPMRGNEIHWVMATRPFCKGFPIPMRGNEERVETLKRQLGEVSDPHEG